MLMSVCGIDCEGCKYFQRKECSGCAKLKGKVWWVQYIPAETCPIYNCVNQRTLAHCGKCQDLPCQIYFNLKDPEYGDAEHQASIRLRVETLKSLV